jgi:branched-chain amino acid transport system ATP-binding protein
MTVVENVMLGRQGHAGERLWPNWFARKRVARIEAAAFARAMELLEFVALESHANEPAAVLSGGQRKLLELARVLMAEPALILLDEPAAGVNPALLETIVEKIAALHRRGITFLIIEHNMDMVTQLCRPIIVMAQGRVIFEGEPDAMLRHATVREAYLGAAAA